MAAWQKAINEIASILTQTGIPPGHSQDIAARLSNALESYYDSRQAAGNSRNFNARSASTAAFQNEFRPPESQPIPGSEGKKGKDGEYAWAKDGKDGTGGTDGKAGDTGTSGLDGADGEPGGSFGGASCQEILRKIKACGGNPNPKCDCDNCNPKCCAGYGGTGILNGQSLCAAVDAQARMLREIRGRLDAIEEILADTVDCK